MWSCEYVKRGESMVRDVRRRDCRCGSEYRCCHVKKGEGRLGKRGEKVEVREGCGHVKRGREGVTMWSGRMCGHVRNRAFNAYYITCFGTELTTLTRLTRSLKNDADL